MIITYYGLQFFKIQQGDLTIGYNPVSKKSGSSLKQIRFGSDIALVSLDHHDFNGIENLTHGEKEPFVVAGPGEYERHGVSVHGYLTKTQYGGKGERLNTVYTVSLDGVKLCFLGPLDDASLSEEIQEEIGNPDILFVPIGDADVLSPTEAYKLSLALEPKVIIPMHYAPSGNGTLKKFLKEAGAEKAELLPKLTVKKKEIEEKEGEVIVLQIAE